MFRIVQEKRGDVVTGLRVQKLGFTRMNVDTGVGSSEVWRNKGRRVYTMKDAEALRTYLESEQRAALPPVEYVEVSTADHAQSVARRY